MNQLIVSLRINIRQSIHCRQISHFFLRTSFVFFVFVYAYYAIDGFIFYTESCLLLECQTQEHQGFDLHSPEGKATKCRKMSKNAQGGHAVRDDLETSSSSLLKCTQYLIVLEAYLNNRFYVKRQPMCSVLRRARVNQAHFLGSETGFTLCNGALIEKPSFSFLQPFSYVFKNRKM